LATELSQQGNRADVIHANNVLAHVPDLNDFARGLRTLLKEGGVCIIEVPYVRDLIDRCEFDTIYHEHLSYFSLTALNQLFERHDLAIQNVERLAIHGGSLRIFAGVRNSSEKNSTVTELLDEEKRWGVDRLEFYQGFAR